MSKRLAPAGDPIGCEGIMYFIGGNTGPIKVGFTRDLPVRLRRLQMSSPKALRVLAAVYADRSDELEFHRLFRAWRLHGEWFKRSPEVLHHIAWWQERMSRSPGGKSGLE